MSYFGNASKISREAARAAERRRVWYVMTSRLGREHRERGKRGTEPARGERADVGIGPYGAKNNGSGPSGTPASTEKEKSNAEV